jgi:hypothetical protein
MKQFYVYAETAGGAFLDEFYQEAETIDQAYEKVYEKYNWQPVHLEVEEVFDTLMETFFGVNPLDKFPSMWGTPK